MNVQIKIKDITFNNPIWSASGTFNYGREFQIFFDVNALGAIVTKTVTLKPTIGNRPPRIVETPSGLLNSIGLENDGAEAFIKKAYPFLMSLKTKVIISVAANNEKELIECIRMLDKLSFPTAFEINLSCPNIHHPQQGCVIAQDKHRIKAFLTTARRHTDKLIIAKLTPNVTDIAEMAEIAEQAQADAVSLVNTYLGLAVNAYTMKPVLGNTIGGLSGPAIKPLAQHAVWKAFHQISIPIIGVGGIMNGIDAAEFMLCGASAVQIGTANFISPNRIMSVLKEFKHYLGQQKITALNQLIGGLKQTMPME